MNLQEIKLTTLNTEESMHISGGSSDFAYDLGYALGKLARLVNDSQGLYGSASSKKGSI